MNKLKQKKGKNSTLRNFFKKTKIIFLITIRVVFSIFISEKKEETKENKLDNGKNEFDDKNEDLKFKLIDKEIDLLKSKEYNEKTKKIIIEVKKEIKGFNSTYYKYLLYQRLDKVEEELKEEKEDIDILEEITNTLTHQEKKLITLTINDEIKDYLDEIPNEKEDKDKEKDNEERTTYQNLVDTITLNNEFKTKEKAIKNNKIDNKEILESAKEQISRNNKKNDINIITKKNENIDFEKIIDVNVKKSDEIIKSYDEKVEKEKDNNKKNIIKIRTINKCLISIIAATIIINRLKKKNKTPIIKNIIKNAKLSINRINENPNTKKNLFFKTSKREKIVALNNNKNSPSKINKDFMELKREIIRTIPEELKDNAEITILLEYLAKLEQEINLLIENNLEKTTNKILIKKV